MIELRTLGALDQSLRFLRRELGDGILNGHGDEEVGFEPATLWFDALAFQQACDAGEPARALQLYRGDFLAGFFVNDGSAELERRRRWRSAPSGTAISRPRRARRARLSRSISTTNPPSHGSSSCWTDPETGPVR